MSFSKQDQIFLFFMVLIEFCQDNSQTEAMSVSSTTHFEYLFDSTTTEKWQSSINSGGFGNKSTTTTEKWQSNINAGRFGNKPTTTTEKRQFNNNVVYVRTSNKSRTAGLDQYRL
ncbi:uncharacterized protein LOC132727094 [Ruditapes philippinarum]|uniref:uncharacterized protein LOC132727094 n=1 Tax=Ruditapes philippinarum TaxID=129788 RepID=UPI00295C1ABF|nr:uncharacterized protein LOC132727094 [Ruditapes philippinarum]